MKLIEDKDLIYDVKDYDVVLVGLNIMNTMGNGFPHKVAVSFKNVAKSNKETAYGDPKKLGTVRVVRGKPDGPLFALCYISRGRYRPDKVPDTVDYQALTSCLDLVAKTFPTSKIATTIIGSSEYEGGGDRDRILELMEAHLKGLDVHVYDYEQIDYRLEDNLTYKTIRNDYLTKKITKEEYYERKKKYVWERTLGLYIPMPEGSYSEIKNLLNEYRKKRDGKE
jgi:hypothetical protein